MATKKGMTENSRKVLAFLKEKGVGVKFTHKAVADALGFKSAAAVVGSITGLEKKGCAVRVKEDIVKEDGKKDTVSVFWLTEKGLAYDPDEVAEETAE